MNEREACVHCGGPVEGEGEYSIHDTPEMDGPERVLCAACGADDEPSCDAIWQRIEESQSVTIDYTNWRGERRKRNIIPRRMRFGSNEWHRTPGWLMDAFDLDACEERTFSLANVHSWSPR